MSTQNSGPSVYSTPHDSTHFPLCAENDLIALPDLGGGNYELGYFVMVTNGRGEFLFDLSDSDSAVEYGYLQFTGSLP